MEGYEDLRFSLNSELSCIVNRCMLPFLRSLLLESNDSFFVFLAMEVQFQQLSNPEDRATRWTSHRHVTVIEVTRPYTRDKAACGWARMTGKSKCDR